MAFYPESPTPQSVVALFHFHAHLDVCTARVDLLRRLNPDLRIFGMYGGDEPGWPEANALAGRGLEHVHYALRSATGRSRWKDTDICVTDWYREFGHRIDFDRVHVLQYDLLFLAPLDRVYPPLPHDAVALTGLVPLREVAPIWNWLTAERLAGASQRLLEYVREQFAYRDEPYACIGPGYSLPRTFLERYTELDLDPALGHDELRLPLMAQILGAPVCNTGFYPRWVDPEVEAVFNAESMEIEVSRVEQEAAKPGGRRVFHPCRTRYDRDVVDRLAAMAMNTDARDASGR